MLLIEKYYNVRVKTKHLSLFIFSLFFCAHHCFAQEDSDITILDHKASFIGDHYAFLGFMNKNVKTNEIQHFFRLDDGMKSSHAGPKGAIVVRKSFDDGENWTSPELVYKDEYDDRISSGGVLDNGDIILFMGRYNVLVPIASFVDFGYICSKDNGKTWSSYVCISCNKDNFSLPYNIFKIPTKSGYFCASYFSYYADIRYSPDGYNWDSVYYKWDYRVSKEINISEPSISYVGNGKLIALFRVEAGAIHQSVSYDYGKTWSYPVPTNIANSYFCSQPLNFYDEALQRVFTIACDRRGMVDNHLNLGSGVWVYCSEPKGISDSAETYKNSKFLLRGKPNIARLLGYPVYTKLNDSTYLILYSEANFRSDWSENAELYQFKIHLGIDLYKNREIQKIKFDSLLQVRYDAGIVIPKASSTSNLKVKFFSSDTKIAKIINDTICIVSAGKCIIVAKQFGNSEYKPADSVFRWLIINKAQQKIKFEQLQHTFQNDTILHLEAYATSGLDVYYTLMDDKNAILSNNELHLFDVGDVRITAHQDGNENYEPAPCVEHIFTIKGSELKVSPNPASSSILIKNTHSSVIQIINCFGDIVIEDYNCSESRSFDIRSLNSGIYIVRIVSNNRIRYSMFIKQ